jgi:hypothetical protein
MDKKPFYEFVDKEWYNAYNKKRLPDRTAITTYLYVFRYNIKMCDDMAKFVPKGVWLACGEVLCDDNIMG